MTRCLSFFLLVALAGALHADQQLTITSPTAAAQVPVGSLCTIAWTAQGLEGKQLKIEVDG
jgi:hypothetical protein